MGELKIRQVEIKATIVCQSCHREVETYLITCGLGYIGVCPLCGELAYHGDELPENIDDGSPEK